MLKSVIQSNATNGLTKRFFKSAPPLFSMAVEAFYRAKSFEGEQSFFSHYSDVLKCRMKFGIYLPPTTVKDNVKCPVLYLLNGYTGCYETLMRSTGFQRFASRFGVCAVSPDTMPHDIPMDEIAAFYIDATKEEWKEHYQMHTYVTKELIELISTKFPVQPNHQSIFGFSMGGYGALNCFLKNPGLYQSVSAMAPICNPILGGLGNYGLRTFLGEDKEEWNKWDPVELLKTYRGNEVDIFIDKGTIDEYDVEKQLRVENFVRASAENDRVRIIFKERKGYNHSHFFTSTFIHEHIEFHANYLHLK